MKKILLLLLAVFSLSVVSLAGCGKAAEPANDPGPKEAAAEEPAPQEESSAVGLANPWVEITEEKAREQSPRLFKAPEGAREQTWLMCEALGDPANGVEPMVQLSFLLDDMNFTARAQMGVAEDADISGIYTEWTAGPQDVTLANWGEGHMAGKTYRSVNDAGYINLITWYDVEIGIKYSLSVAAADLDGFDIQAVAEQMYAEENEPVIP